MPESPTGPVIQFLDASAARADFTAAERSVLDALNQKVAAAESLDALMNFVFEATREVFPCDRIGLAFLSEDGGRLVAHWARALYEPLLLKKGYAEDLPGSSLAQVLSGGRLRIIGDLEAYLRDHPASNSTRLLVREGVRSSLTCPLKVEGRNVGVMFRSSRHAYAYGPREVGLHLAIAERLSQAVEKAWRIEQLEAANRAYFEMLGFVSHELKSPLASIVMAAQNLTDGYYGELAAPQKDKVQRMAGSARHLLSLIRDYLDLARLEGGELKLNARAGVDFVGEIYQPALDIIRPQLDASHMRLVEQGLDRARPWECDADLLRIVLVNLLGNAVKYGREGGEIAVRFEAPAGQVRVAVSNEGPGFPESEQGKLFRKFSRLQTPELLKRKGTGVGLYTTWRIVQLHGGKISAKSEPGRWAEFTFELPQPLPAAEQEGESGEKL